MLADILVILLIFIQPVIVQSFQSVVICSPSQHQYNRRRDRCHSNRRDTVTDLVLGKLKLQLFVTCYSNLNGKCSHNMLSMSSDNDMNEDYFHKNLVSRKYTKNILTKTSTSGNSDKNCSDGKNNDTKSLRILGLHGSEGNSEEFILRLKPLIDHILQNNEKDIVEIQVDALTAPFAKGNGYAWWTMNKGERSFNAKNYIGFDTSSSIVLAAINNNLKKEKRSDTDNSNIQKTKEEVSESNEYDIIFSHSQGAILVSSLLALQRIKCHPSVGYILNGVAYPNPYDDKLKNTKSMSTTSTDRNSEEKDESDPPSSSSSYNMLFIMGKNDKINPISSAIKTRDALIQQQQLNHEADIDGKKSITTKTRTETFEHDGGHSVPLKNEEALEAITKWITSSL